MTFKVELPPLLEVRVTVVGLRLVIGPEGETVDDKLTVLENPLRVVRVMVEVPDDPWIIFNELGFAEIAKSGDDGCVTVTETLVECECDPPVPVTVTV